MTIFQSVTDLPDVTIGDAAVRRADRSPRLDVGVRQGRGAARRGALHAADAGGERPASGRRRFTISTWRWGAATPAASPCRRSTSARWPTTPRARSSAPAKKLNAGAFIFEIARSEIGYTEQRPHEYAAVVLGAALREGFTRPDLHPGRSRPDQRQEVQQPGSRQGARRAARADPGRDRRRLLQHRHRHVDAGRSRQGRRSTSSRK